MKKESWINCHWHSLMAIMFMVITFCDFVLLPILAMSRGQVWQPLTPSGGGLFYFSYAGAMGFGAWQHHREPAKQP